MLHDFVSHDRLLYNDPVTQQVRVLYHRPVHAPQDLISRAFYNLYCLVYVPQDRVSHNYPVAPQDTKKYYAFTLQYLTHETLTF
jgi:hypothetical protein